MRRPPLIALSVLAWTAMVGGGAQAASPPAPALVVIVNPKNPVANLSEADLNDLFRLDRQFWLPGVRVTLVLREAEDPEHLALCARLLKVTPAELGLIHLRKSYRGVLTAKIIVAHSSEEMRSLVATLPSAIGYVWRGEVDTRVRAVGEYAAN